MTLYLKTFSLFWHDADFVEEILKDYIKRKKRYKSTDEMKMMRVQSEIRKAESILKEMSETETELFSTSKFE